MGEAKFTEGPWSWSHIGEKTNGFIVGTAYDKDGNQLSGFIEDDLLFDEELLHIGQQIGEIEGATYNYANASLIAAAPDQHEALESAPRPTSDNFIEWMAAYTDWYFKTRGNALARARGENQS